MCMVSLNSSIVNEIRLLKVCSSHIIANSLIVEVNVLCFAIPNNEKVYNFPQVSDRNSFILTSNLSNR